jgi:DNA processing protein
MSITTTTSDWVCLSLLPGLGPGGIKRLVEYFDGPGNVLRTELKDLSAVPGMRASQLNGFRLLNEYRKQAECQIEWIRNMGGAILAFDDPGYPLLLRQIPDPPTVLYAHGNIELLSKRSLAIVGSRAATAYGRRVAFSFSEKIARHDIIIVSGLALGIDSESHAGALQAGGETIAVLGCGLDVVYPKHNIALFEQIRCKGLLLSEYPLGTQPEAFRFPARNRIIAGISSGVLVVEAARRSGSLITAQMGLDFGRDIFAVPGQVDSFKSEGTHWLLREGAQLVVSADDILEALQFSTLCHDGKSEKEPENILSGMDPDAVALLQLLEPYPMSRDEAADKAGLPPARISELFLFLELEGHIEMLPGDMVRRVTI